MAKLNSQSVLITVSELLRATDNARPILSDDTITELETIISELAGKDVMVEINSIDLDD